jgi:integrase
MPKSTRHRGDGSVYAVAGRGWRGSIIVTDPLTGRTRRRYITAPTEREAVAKLRAIRADRDAGRAATRTPTLADYLARWIVTVRARIRPTTAEGYARMLATYVVPTLGRRRLADLTPGDIERMTTALIARGIAPSTAAQARTVLVVALSDAERDGLVARNVARLARPPRVPARQYAIPDPADVRRLLALAADAEYGELFTVALTTGLRRGELAGLTWEDVDTDVGTLTVRRTITEDGKGRARPSEPKSARSLRTIALPPAALAALHARRTAQDAERHAAGPDWQDRTGYVFTDALGRPLRLGTIDYAWRTLADRAGLPAMRLHDARHAVASMLLAAGVPVRDVADSLGHSPRVLLGTYAHAMPGARQRVADAIADALSDG